MTTLMGGSIIPTSATQHCRILVGATKLLRVIRSAGVARFPGRLHKLSLRQIALARETIEAG